MALADIQLSRGPGDSSIVWLCQRTRIARLCNCAFSSVYTAHRVNASPVSLFRIRRTIVSAAFALLVRVSTAQRCHRRHQLNARCSRCSRIRCTALRRLA